MNNSIFLKSVFLWVLVAASGLLLDYFLHQKGLPRRDLLIVSNVAMGFAVAIVFYKLADSERKRRLRAEGRLKIVAEMNHHVRNALQVIAYHDYRASEREKVGIVRDAIKRIEWALREILPQVGVSGGADLMPPERQSRSQLDCSCQTEHQHGEDDEGHSDINSVPLQGKSHGRE